MIVDVNVTVEGRKESKKKSFSFKEAHFKVTCRIASNYEQTFR